MASAPWGGRLIVCVSLRNRVTQCSVWRCRPTTGEPRWSDWPPSVSGCVYEWRWSPQQCVLVTVVQQKHKATSWLSNYTEVLLHYGCYIVILQNPGSVHLSGTGPEVNGVCSRLTSILRFKFPGNWLKEIMCNLADKPTNRETNGHRWKHYLLCGGKIIIFSKTIK